MGDFPSCFYYIRKPIFYSHALLFMQVKHSKQEELSLVFTLPLSTSKINFYLYQFIKSCFRVHELSQRRYRDNNPRISSKLPQNLSFLRYVSVKKNHGHCSLICIKVMTANSDGINAVGVIEQIELYKQNNKQTPGGRCGLLKG